MRLKTTLLATTFAIGLGLSSAPGNAEQFRAATYNGPGSPVTNFLEDYSKRVKEMTNGDIDFEVITGGVLFPADGTLEAMEAGVAQFTNLTAAYIPSKMPVDAVSTDASFVADDQMALAFAKTELAMFNDDMQKELSKFNIVFGGGFTIGIYNLICGFDAASIEDFKGKKLRTSSGAMISFTESIGGVPVSVSAPEIYTGIQRGSLDCTFGTPLFLTDFFKLTEVAKSVYKIPLGTNPNGGYIFNKDFWKERTPDQRRVLLDAMAPALAKSMIEWGARIDKAWAATKEAGIPIHEPEPAAMEHLAKFNEELIAGLPKKEMEERGVEDPTDLLAEYQALIAKWKGLLADVDRTDEAAVAGLLKSEIFDKVDVNTYGTN